MGGADILVCRFMAAFQSPRLESLPCMVVRIPGGFACRAARSTGDVASAPQPER